MQVAEEKTNCLLLALAFLEKADKLGSNTKPAQQYIEEQIEEQAGIMACQIPDRSK